MVRQTRSAARDRRRVRLIRARRLVDHRLGQAEVEDVRFTVGIDENIARFEVAVDDAALMGVQNGLGDALEESEPRRDVELVGLEILAQRQAADIVHRIVHSPIRCTAVVDRDDVGMFELGGDGDLAFEPPLRLFRSKRAFQQELQGDISLRRKVCRFVHESHAAAADETNQLEVAQTTAT